MDDADILCAGIIVADHVCAPIDHLPTAGELVMADNMLLTIGGCAANVAVDLTRLGVPATVVGCVGDDIFGRIVADMLRENQVNVSGLRVKAGLDTSQTLIVNVKGQDRRFIHTFGANGHFSAADFPLDRLSRCKILYVGGYLAMPKLTQDALAEVFAQARSLGVKTYLDVVVPGPGNWTGQLDTLLPHTDVFKPNHHEGAIITGESDPLRQAEAFRRLGAKTVIVSLGSEGAMLVNDQVRLRSGIFSMPNVDSSGGGDAFSAGFMCGLLRNLGPEDCLRMGSALGGSCVRAIGTTPGVFTRAECEAFLESHELKIDRI